MLDFSDVSDDILVHSIAYSNMNAFQLLFERYYSKIVQFIWARTASPEQSQTIAQLVFAELWSCRASIHTLVTYKLYLFCIAADYIMHYDHHAINKSPNGSHITIDPNHCLCLANMSQTISTEEKSRLQAWLNKDQAHRDYYNRLAKICSKKESYALPFTPDKNAAWQKLEGWIAPTAAPSVVISPSSSRFPEFLKRVLRMA
jgi:hypothetical protein